MDKKLFQETFSQLKASEQAKQEVFAMANMERIHHHSSFLRRALITAAAVAALAVTAAAADLATGGELLGRVFSFVEVDQDHLLITDDTTGEQFVLTSIRAEVEERDSRIFLLTNTEEFDITDALAADGMYRYTYETAHPTTGETDTVTIEVTPGPEGGWQACATTGSSGMGIISYHAPSSPDFTSGAVLPPDAVE